MTLRSSDKERGEQVSRTFKIITLGCKVNQYESACLREALFLRGWTEAPKGVKAQVNVVNTCIVTQNASYQSRQAIRKVIKENPAGLTAAITNPLEAEIKQAILAADVMMGNDENCTTWIMANRQEGEEGGERRTRRRERRHRR